MADDPQFSLEMEAVTEDEMRSEFKRMVHNVASQLSEDQLKEVRYLKSIKSDDKALQVLESLEQRGEFSFSNVGPLEQLMREIPRVDLIQDHIGPYREKYRQLQEAGVCVCVVWLCQLLKVPLHNYWYIDLHVDLRT